MKKKLKNILFIFLKKVSSSSLFWALYKPIAEVNAEIYLSKKREEFDQRQGEIYERYKYLLSNTIKNGPFKGLQYPFLKSIHSTLYPKLLGYYELELHGIFPQIFKKTYVSIVDVGCAEGYYAVGLAKKFPSSTVFAADLLPEAREKTEQMANFNGLKVSDKFHVLEKVDTEFLLGLDPAQMHLIFSDCEGYESNLFTENVISHLSSSDFIIELHDFIIPGISDLLKKRFESTHQIKVIQSIDDVFRYREIDDEEIGKIPLLDQRKLLAENRPSQMEWIYCEAKV